MEIAALGLSVDSKPATNAAADLRELAQAAKTAESAFGNLERGAGTAATATRNYSDNMTKAVNSTAAINARLNVRDSFADVARAEDMKAYGAEMDRLRAKYNPLFAAEQQHIVLLADINRASRVGAISETERAQAVSRADAAYKASVVAIERTNSALSTSTRNAGLSRQAMANLSFQLNDVATMALLGAPPLQILASQGGQVFQILQQGAGGVSGSLRDLASTITGLITPFRAFGLGVVAAFTGAAVAVVQYVNAQKEVELALVGTGSAAGLTAQSIEDIATRAAAARQATVGDARQMALAFAATGVIGEEISIKAIAMARNVAKIFSESATEGAERLARALADPARGVDDMNKRLQAFDDSTTQHVRNLSEQNNRLEAQRILLDGVGRSTQVASEMTSGWEYAWNRVTESASRLWNLLGRNVARELGLESMSQRVETLQKDIYWLSQMWDGWGATVNRVNIATKVAELNKLTTALNLMREGITANRDSRTLGDEIRRLVPDSATLQGLQNDLAKLRSLSAQPGTFERLDTTTAQNLGRSIDIKRAQIDSFKTAVELQKEEFDLEMQRIAARTPAQKAEVAFLETRNRLMRTGQFTGNEAAQAGEFARARLMAQAAEELKRSQEQQNLQGRQSVELAQQEYNLIGRTTYEQQLQRDLLQAKQQAQQEALRLYGDENAYDQKHLNALQEQIKRRSAINELARQQNLFNDVAFERAQLGRTAGDQEAYSRLKAAGMLTDGQIQGTAAEAAAAQIRLNESLRTSIDMTREFGSSFMRDMMSGTKAVDALANSLQRLAQRFADRWLDKTLSMALGGQNGLLAQFGGGGGTVIGSSGIGLGGTTTVTPVFHAGGVVGAANDNAVFREVSSSVFKGARRYHSGGVAGLSAGEVPAILQHGETVLPRGTNIQVQPPKVEINISTPEGTTARTQQTPDGQGGFSIDVFIEQIDAALGQRVSQGGSVMGNAMSQRFGLSAAAGAR